MHCVDCRCTWFWRLALGPIFFAGMNMKIDRPFSNVGSWLYRILNISSLDMLRKQSGRGFQGFLRNDMMFYYGAARISLF